MQDNLQLTRLEYFLKIKVGLILEGVFFFLVIIDLLVGEITHQIAWVAWNVEGQRGKNTSSRQGTKGICRSFVNHYKRFCICDSAAKQHYLCKDYSVLTSKSPSLAVDANLTLVNREKCMVATRSTAIDSQCYKRSSIMSLI